MSLVGGMIVIGLGLVIIGGMTILVSREIKKLPNRTLPPEDQSSCSNFLFQIQSTYGTNAHVSLINILIDDPTGSLSTNLSDYIVESSTNLVHWEIEPEMQDLSGISQIATNRLLPCQFFRMVPR